VIDYLKEHLKQKESSKKPTKDIASEGLAQLNMVPDSEEISEKPSNQAAQSKYEVDLSEQNYGRTWSRNACR
jgi:hypothetical protein